MIFEFSFKGLMRFKGDGNSFHLNIVFYCQWQMICWFYSIHKVAHLLILLNKNWWFSSLTWMYLTQNNNKNDVFCCKKLFFKVANKFTLLCLFCSTQIKTEQLEKQEWTVTSSFWTANTKEEQTWGTCSRLDLLVDFFRCFTAQVYLFKSLYV